MTKFRCTAKSHCAAPNPRKRFLETFPCREGFPVEESTGGSAKAAGLNAFRPGNCDPVRYRGWAATRSGRTFARKPLLNSEKFTSLKSTGGAECARITFSSDQPPASTRRTVLFFG